jgi:hypothetical protein
MPLIKEIENVLPFVAELPVGVQESIAKWVSRVVVADDDRNTMTQEERLRLRELDDNKFRRQMRGE